jgi:putative hydrolase of the HAD superfamily
VLLLCDLDDTILDRSGTLRRWATDLGVEHRLGPSAVEEILLLDERVSSREEFVATISENYRLVPALTLSRYYGTYLPMFSCAESVRSALVQARAHGWQIAIVTDGGPMQQEKIDVADLRDLVDVCISAIEGYRKPDPRLLALAADRVGASLDGAWVIGDSARADIGAAVAAGVSSVWLRHGRAWQLDEYRPTADADSFEAAVDFISD